VDDPIAEVLTDEPAADVQANEAAADEATDEELASEDPAVEEPSAKEKPPKLPPLAPILSSLRAELAAKDEQLKSYITAYKQASADMERERTRLERDRERTASRDRMNMVSSLLDVLDNFGRSLDSCRAGGSDTDLLTGLELVHKQFLESLQALGVEPMGLLVGKPFDPALHEATGMVPASGEQVDQEIIFEERPGYTFAGQLLRPARVVVASKPG
jgi:molecular chaperone GrpE